MEVMTQKIQFEQAKEILMEYLGENRKYKTSERILILKEICQCQEPFTIKNICDVTGFNKSLIYDNIPIFLESNLITRIPPKKGDPLNYRQYKLIGR